MAEADLVVAVGGRQHDRRGLGCGRSDDPLRKGLVFVVLPNDLVVARGSDDLFREAL